MLENMKEWITAIIFIALVAAAFALALDGFQDNIVSDTTSTAVSNESVTIIANNTYSTLFNGKCVTGISCTVVKNNSFVITGNSSLTVTCSGSSIKILDRYDTGGFGFNNDAGSKVNVTYSCGVRNAQYNITDTGLKGTLNASGYFGTIGTIIGVAALIIIVVSAFYFAKK